MTPSSSIRWNSHPCPACCSANFQPGEPAGLRLPPRLHLDHAGPRFRVSHPHPKSHRDETSSSRRRTGRGRKRLLPRHANALTQFGRTVGGTRFALQRSCQSGRACETFIKNRCPNIPNGRHLIETGGHFRGTAFAWAFPAGEGRRKLGRSSGGVVTPVGLVTQGKASPSRRCPDSPNHAEGRKPARLRDRHRSLRTADAGSCRLVRGRYPGQHSSRREFAAPRS